MIDFDKFFENNEKNIMDIASQNGHHLIDGTLTISRNDPWMFDHKGKNDEHIKHSVCFSKE